MGLLVRVTTVTPGWQWWQSLLGANSTHQSQVLKPDWSKASSMLGQGRRLNKAEGLGKQNVSRSWNSNWSEIFFSWLISYKLSLFSVLNLNISGDNAHLKKKIEWLFPSAFSARSSPPCDRLLDDRWELPWILSLVRTGPGCKMHKGEQSVCNHIVYVQSHCLCEGLCCFHFSRLWHISSSSKNKFYPFYSFITSCILTIFFNAYYFRIVNQLGFPFLPDTRLYVSLTFAGSLLL